MSDQATLQIVQGLPHLLETSTGRWIEVQSGKQAAAINLLRSDWVEPFADNDGLNRFTAFNRFFAIQPIRSLIREFGLGI